MRGRYVPKEFQSQVHILTGDPADDFVPQRLAQAGGLFFDRVLNMLGKLNGDEGAQEAHAMGSCLLQNLFHCTFEIEKANWLGQVHGCASFKPNFDVARHAFCGNNNDRN